MAQPIGEGGWKDIYKDKVFDPKYQTWVDPKILKEREFEANRLKEAQRNQKPVDEVALSKEKLALEKKSEEAYKALVGFQKTGVVPKGYNKKDFINPNTGKSWAPPQIVANLGVAPLHQAENWLHSSSRVYKSKYGGIRTTQSILANNSGVSKVAGNIHTEPTKPLTKTKGGLTTSTQTTPLATTYTQDEPVFTPPDTENMVGGNDSLATRKAVGDFYGDDKQPSLVSTNKLPPKEVMRVKGKDYAIKTGIDNLQEGGQTVPNVSLGVGNTEAQKVEAALGKASGDTKPQVANATPVVDNKVAEKLAVDNTNKVATATGATASTTPTTTPTTTKGNNGEWVTYKDEKGWQYRKNPTTGNWETRKVIVTSGKGSSSTTKTTSNLGKITQGQYDKMLSDAEHRTPTAQEATNDEEFTNLISKAGGIKSNIPSGKQLGTYRKGLALIEQMKNSGVIKDGTFDEKTGSYTIKNKDGSFKEVVLTDDGKGFRKADHSQMTIPKSTTSTTKTIPGKPTVSYGKPVDLTSDPKFESTLMKLNTEFGSEVAKVEQPKTEIKTSVDGTTPVTPTTPVTTIPTTQPNTNTGDKSYKGYELGDALDLARFGIGLQGAMQKSPTYEKPAEWNRYVGRMRDLSEQGLTPEEKAYMGQQAERGYAYDNANIMNLAGGNSGVALSNLGRAASTLQDSKGRMSVADAQMRRQNLMNYGGVLGQDVGMDRQIYQDKLATSTMNKQGGAQLANDAVRNFIDRRQYNEMYKDPNSPYNKLLTAQADQAGYLADIYRTQRDGGFVNSIQTQAVNPQTTQTNPQIGGTTTPVVSTITEDMYKKAADAMGISVEEYKKRFK